MPAYYLRQWTPKTYLLWAAYVATVWIFDTLDDVIHLLYKPRKPIRDNKPSDIDHLGAEEIRALIEWAPNVPGALRGGYVKRLTSTLVVKSVEDARHTPDASEALALQMVLQETTIPVPRLRMVIDIDTIRYAIMDHIPGRQLYEVWPSLGYIARMRVAITLRRYIRQLRAIRPRGDPIPGPLSSNGPRECDSLPIFGALCPTRGPFASYAEMSAFFNERDAMVPQRTAGASPQPFDDSRPLVFTHQNLNMRNIMVGDDGQLWLLDWAWAGYYPCWFEFVAMKQLARIQAIVVNREEPFWDALIPFICDPYFGQAIWHARMVGAFMYR